MGKQIYVQFWTLSIASEVDYLGTDKEEYHNVSWVLRKPREVYHHTPSPGRQDLFYHESQLWGGGVLAMSGVAGGRNSLLARVMLL